MKSFKFINIIMVLALMCFGLTACSSDNDDNGGDGGGGTGDGGSVAKLAEPYFGVNMSGAEFAAVYPGVDGTHYGYPGRSDIEYFANKGFKLIRIPFRWERVQKQLGGELDQVELAKMKAVVSAAQELGVYVILDLHNFGRYCTYSNGYSSADNNYAILGSRTCSSAHFCDLWKRLAKEFMGYTNIWGYDIMNEPHDMLKSSPWDKLAQECIDAIREVDKQTPIVVEGNEYASSSKWTNLSQDLKDLTDPSDKLIFQAHVYFDNDASGKYVKNYDEEKATEDIGVERLKPFVEWCKKYGKQGFVGEYGVPDNDPRWLVTLDKALEYLSENGIGGTYWSAGPRWGDDALAVQPINGQDRPQMSVLGKYFKAK